MGMEFEVALDELEVGTADTAGGDLDQHLIVGRHGKWSLDQAQWRIGGRGGLIELSNPDDACHI